MTDQEKIDRIFTVRKGLQDISFAIENTMNIVENTPKFSAVFAAKLLRLRTIAAILHAMITDGRAFVSGTENPTYTRHAMPQNQASK